MSKPTSPIYNTRRYSCVRLTCMLSTQSPLFFVSIFWAVVCLLSGPTLKDVGSKRCKRGSASSPLFFSPVCTAADSPTLSGPERLRRLQLHLLCISTTASYRSVCCELYVRHCALHVQPAYSAVSCRRCSVAGEEQAEARIVNFRVEKGNERPWRSVIGRAKLADTAARHPSNPNSDTIQYTAPSSSHFCRRRTASFQLLAGIANLTIGCAC